MKMEKGMKKVYSFWTTKRMWLKFASEHHSEYKLSLALQAALHNEMLAYHNVLVRQAALDTWGFIGNGGELEKLPLPIAETILLDILECYCLFIVLSFKLCC